MVRNLATEANSMARIVLKLVQELCCKAEFEI